MSHANLPAQATLAGRAYYFGDSPLNFSLIATPQLSRLHQSPCCCEDNRAALFA
jgi:hypothetical protein